MVAVASVVVAVGTVTGTVSALDDGHPAKGAQPLVTHASALGPPSDVPTPSHGSAAPSPSGRATPKPVPDPSPTVRRSRTAAAPALLYRHFDSQVRDWLDAHPGDARRAVIESRIADRPAAVWFADFTPATVTARVRAVTSAAAARGRVPVLVPYTIPQRDCDGASEGGAPDLAAYDGWIDGFAAGLGSGEVVVVLEPDSVAQSDCLTEGGRADRFASLARAGRVLKAANPRARVYYDAGNSDWNPAAAQAALLRRAGAASPASSDGVFTNVSNFNRTSDEIAYARRVLSALGGPAGLGAVIDTSRNGNGAAPGGAWCDPPGRRIGPAPTLNTGEEGIDAYLWVKPPGESDGCRGTPGTFSADYAYELAG
ncbi:glycoside hydrolase family 6 protein [Streptomyces rhizosphaerihabitans]|uniref:glycoside hydrolase family 6 protein n=1 Tax=Streptomyces rhizosphaerihabitans TaxID=1266770 RepID=UPI0021BF9451|nr:glycoside hydrolase family 6 protein [Streptomyces rhizosphaerihabitans]MCT9004289.1 glycoside hydrolase family 6 protein [Streptomyces rhizosphaerihabitans]